MGWHDPGQMGKGRDILQRGGQFRRTPKAMRPHSLRPVRGCGTAALDTGHLCGQGTGARLVQRRYQCNAMGEGFASETQPKFRDTAAARAGLERATRAGWERAKGLIRDPAIRFVLLDEINVALR